MIALLWVCAVLTQGGEERFQLENGMKVILLPADTPDVTCTGLAFKAGVTTEPEGRCGISHVLEHVFLYGPTESYPDPFKRLTKAGATGNSFMDVNAETMWNLTYFYALQKGSDNTPLFTALKVFAEKMDHAKLTQEILDRERPNVLAEIRGVEAMLKEKPLLRKQMEAQVRYPKAGFASHVEVLTLEHLEAYRANRYRPDQAILVVSGDFDSASTRAEIKKRFGSIGAMKRRPLDDGSRKDLPAMVVASYPCSSASAEERVALRVAAAAWQQMLREHGRAYVEHLPDGTIRAVLFGKDGGPLEETRRAIQKPLSKRAFRRARFATQRPVRMRALNLKPTDPKVLAQSTINRLIFEVEGGPELLEALKKVTPEAVAAAAAKFLIPPPPPKAPPPDPDSDPPLTVWVAIGASAAMILCALIVRIHRHMNQGS